MSLGVGSAGWVKATVKPSLPITYTSRNTSIATVSSDGVVVGEGIGETIIDISSSGVTKQVAITVSESQTVITIEPLSLVLRPNEISTFSATVTPQQEITFTSNDPLVADVLYDGTTVIAHSVGKTQIVATAGDTSRVIGILVVDEDTTVLNIEPEYMAIQEGASRQIVATSDPVLPITFESKDSSIATVDSSGLVLGVVNGMTEILVTANGTTRSVLVRVLEIGHTDEEDIDYEIDDEEEDYIQGMANIIRQVTSTQGLPVLENPTVEFVSMTTYGQYRFRIIGNGQNNWADDWNILNVLRDSIVNALPNQTTGWFMEHGGNQVVIAVQ